MNASTDPAMLIRQPDVIATAIDDGMILLNIECNNYVSLNSSAAAIWDMLATPQTAATIVDGLVSKYNVDEQTALAATERTLDELTAEGLLTATAVEK